MSEPTPLSYATGPQQRHRRTLIVRLLVWMGITLCWLILAAAMIGGVVYAVADSLGVLPALLAPIGLILLLVAGATLARGARRVNDLTVLNYLQGAVELNLPLPALLAAAEVDERGAVRSRLLRLRKRLVSGEAVAGALEQAAPSLPRRMTGLVAAGESTGRLATSIRRIAVRRDFLPAFDPADSIYRRWYPLVVTPLFVIVLQAALLFVFPKMEYLAKDFQVSPPVSLTWMAEWFTDAAPVVFALCAVIILIASGRMLSQIFTPHGLTFGPFRRPAEVILWWTPVAGGIARHRALADACHVIAEGLEAGMPLSHSILAAASTSSNFVLQRRLRRLAAELLTGTDLSSAVGQARFPKLLRSLLAPATSDATSRDVFRFLSYYYETRFSRVSALLRAALVPATAIGFGALALLIALGVFEPLVALANRIMGK